MEPIENFEGCGICNTKIKTYIESQFLLICNYLKSNTNKPDLVENDKLTLWLMACLAKTLKEQTEIKTPLPHLLN